MPEAKNQRVAVITGASQGIGAGLVTAYREAGWAVVANARTAALVPVGRVGEVSDVVQAVLFLESALYITGEIVHIDGGQVAGH